MGGNESPSRAVAEMPPLRDGWRYASLGSLLDDRGLSYGIVQPGSPNSGGVPIIRVNNIRNRRIETEDVLKVSPEVESKFRRSRLRGGEVLLTLVGTLGEVAIVPKTLAGWNVARAVGVIPVKKDPGADWVALCLELPMIRHFIQTRATTTVQATFNLRDLAELPIPIPPERVRKAITEFITPLDQKIELNRRMNTTLEAMARALFQSWFVDFDPVRAKMDGRKPEGMNDVTAKLFPDSFQDSPMGPIPKGWKAVRLPEAIDVNPRRTLRKGTVAPYLDMKNVPTYGHCPNNVIDREFTSGTKFENGDTLLARITPCLENGKTAFVDFLDEGQVGWGSTEFIVLSPKPPLSAQYGYLLARSESLRAHAIRNMAGTSGRQRVPSECFNTFWPILPPPAIARRFEAITAPLMAIIKATVTESRTLFALRDPFLPKLMCRDLIAYSTL